MKEDAKRTMALLPDRRSGRVVLLSHCLLNQNTRYAGGACRTCSVNEIVDQARELDLGIVQLPCPEEHAWGGVSKTRFLRLYGLRRRWWARWIPARLLGTLAASATRVRYRRLARSAARQVGDYVDSGYTVVGFVGVDGSPSCGVLTTIDVVEAVGEITQLDPESLTSEQQNELVTRLVRPGTGLFVTELRRALERRNLEVPTVGHDLVGELRGEQSGVDLRELGNVGSHP